MAAVVQSLIKAGAEVNVADEDGGTPLHDLCSAGHLDIVKVVQLFLVMA